MERRAFLSVFGAGLAVSAVQPSTDPLTTSTQETESVLGRTLDMVLKQGVSLPTVEGAFRVVGVTPLTFGGHVIVLASEAGEEVPVEVLRRDETSDAARGVAQTTRFELFLSNGGNGSTATHEAFGLAALSLAQWIAQHEADVDTSAVLTLQQRHAQYGAAALSPESLRG